MSLLSPRPAADVAPRRAGGTAQVEPSALRELRTFTWFPVTALTALLTVSLLAPAAASTAAWPLAVVGSLVGIPHGAVDHLVPWWWSGSGSSPRLRRLALFAAAYTLAAGLALALLLAAPSATFGAFLVLSAVHFGRGEVAAWAERAGRPVPSPARSALPTAAAGLGVVGLLVWSPHADRRLLVPLAPRLATLLDQWRVPGLAAVLVTAAAAAVLLLRAGRRLDAVELALLVVTFAVAPPLAAFGLYFGCWHALRHTGRLLDLAHRPGDAGWAPAARRLAVAGSWPTAAALLTVAALWLLRDVTSLQAEVSALLALTFPHAAVVWAMDRAQAAGDRRDALGR